MIDKKIFKLTKGVWTEVHLQELKKYYEDFFSYTTIKSIPGAGSPTKNIKVLNLDTVFSKYEKIIFHKNGDITVKINYFSFKFWLKSEYKINLTK